MKLCRCDCGYRCGGPGQCSLSIDECLTTDDGKHFVRDCDHEFDGPLIEISNRARSVVCSKCGLSAISHDCAVGP